MKKLCTGIFLFLSILGHSQEWLIPLDVNPLLLDEKTDGRFQKRKALTQADTLDLPFLDDFPGNAFYPDPGHWTDRFAYINSNLAIDMPTLGVATLDVLDESGRIYDHATQQQFLAETLSSVPIDLNLLPSDSVYLSFFYQPGGKVNEPEAKDSLVLEFWSPASSQWYSVWQMAGFKADTFHQAVIPVRDTKYLHKGFRFRFKNYASLNLVDGLPDMTGNQDYWHLDYIYLDKNRSYTDTIYRDVAFISPIKSLLVSYEAMPWDHFLVAKLVEMGNKLGITYRNNGDLITLVTRNFEIRDLSTGSVVHSYTGGSDNIDPFQDFFYNSNITYTYQSVASDTAVFEVKSHLITDVGDYKANDTLRYLQKFLDYYAYDDGTAEKGYGINGEGTSNARLAVKFKSYKPDTLQAVDIFFCRTYQDASQQEFILTVWGDNNGIPGDILYQQAGQLPAYENGLNRFHTYRIEEPLIVNGDFYVGWIQTTQVSLFVGFDADRINNSKTFYYISKNGFWSNSEFAGSLMIRPVFGTRIIQHVQGNATDEGYRLYPNPAGYSFRIDWPQGTDPAKVRIQLFDLSGIMQREFMHQQEAYPVDDLPPGIYLVRLIERNRTMVRKLVIKR